MATPVILQPVEGFISNKKTYDLKVDDFNLDFSRFMKGSHHEMGSGPYLGFPHCLEDHIGIHCVPDNVVYSV